MTRDLARPTRSLAIGTRRLVLLALAVALLAAPATSRAADRDPRFGINQAWQAADAADDAGAGWSRVLFWWSEFQKSGPDEFDLFATDQDSYLDEERDRGRELVGAVINTPGWASTDGSPNGVPRNLYLPWDHPSNYWGRYMRAMAEHYAGRIDSWIIWNEVDIQHGQWRTWNGSLEDYAQLQKVAYRAIKAGNPRATVLPFGAAWWYDEGATISRLLDILQADPESARYGAYLDGMNLHLYSRAGDIPKVIGWYRAELARRRLDKPIWVSETNAIPYDDPVWRVGKQNFRASLDEQASYVIQSFATYLAMGAKRIGVNRMIDGTDFEAGGEPFGLIRNDGTARPAFTAFQVVTRYFGGTVDAEYTPPDTMGLTRVVLRKPGEIVTVTWNMSGQSADVTVPASSPRALRVTKYGQAQLTQAANNQYRFTLAAATANSNEANHRDYVIGGNPLILVERLDGNAQAAYRPIQ